MVKKNYSFVKKYMEHSNSELYINGKRILENKDSCPYEVKPLKTVIYKNREITEEDDDAIIQIGYEELKRNGFAIINMLLTKKEKKKIGATGMVYKLVYYKKGRSCLSNCPRDSKIYLNQSNNTVWAVGPKMWRKNKRLGMSQIFGIERKYKTKKKTGPATIMEDLINIENISQSIVYNSILDEDLSSDYNSIEIEDIPIMINTRGEIVCIEKKGDMQKIGIVGDTGTGKSLTVGRLVGQIFYKFEKDWMCNLNDSLSQFHTTAEPMQTESFVNELFHLGEPAVPIPIVNLYIGSPIIKYIDEKSKICFTYVIDSKEFYNKYTYFTNGIKEQNLGATGRYLNSLKKSLYHCKNGDDVKKALFKEIPDAHKKGGEGKANMIMKFADAIGSSLKYKFIDTLYNDPMIASKWEVVVNGEKTKDEPILACMKAGIMPILNTSFAKGYPTTRNVISSILLNLVKHQKYHRSDVTQRIWVIMDELSDIYKPGEKNDNLTQALIEIFTQGRMHDIGFIYNIQSFSDLHANIITNTTTLICTQIGSSNKDRVEIRKAFQLEKRDVDQLQQLNSKKREIVMIQKYPFIIYTKDGYRKEGEKIYRGKLIPPNINTFRKEEVET